MGLPFKEYQLLRERILQRDEFVCQRCGEWRPRKKLVVHHRRRRVDGGADTPKNLVTLCVPCHVHIHRFWKLAHRSVNQREILEQIFNDLP